ncbi:hypothetical protein [Methylobacillus sp.]|uniref:hypothetical protein n=1 Tax=Methylobacillus sp. TaxID=56818 RepID=UPI002FE3E444
MSTRKQDLIAAFSLCMSMLATGHTHAEGASAPLTDLTSGDPFFYTSDQNIAPGDKLESILGAGRPNKTHSAIPHLPVYFGYMSTNSTYRFVNIVEQVFTMIGEGKHGVWRAQESGYVREYLKKGQTGLRDGSDLMAPQNQKVITERYSSILPDEGWSGYKYPDQRIAADGSLNFIDLPINHPKYQGKYGDHTPIDLPTWYCTMSENDYPYAENAMNFAFAQEGANKIGPLGKRAGLDVKENYTKVLRLQHLPDAASWINTGQKNQDQYHPQWASVDSNKTNSEYYIVERTFFNHPFLFVLAVFDNQDNQDFRYIRPDGPYYEAIKSKLNASAIKTEVTAHPRFWLKDGSLHEAIGLPVFGVHHPDRAAYGGGGACPFKGGDYGRYPEVSAGSGWPTQYEEITPLCDAVLIDIKFYSNLDGRDWTDPAKYLANAGKGTKTITYKMKPGKYGEFTDPYNKKRGATNVESKEVPSTLTLTYPSVSKPVSYVQPPPLPNVAGPVPTAASTCRPVIAQKSLEKGVLTK